MKKVCHITSVHRPNDVRIFLKECCSLAKAGFETYLVATNCESKIINGVAIIGVTANKSSEDRISRILFTTLKVYERALELNADVYHIHDPELLPYALKLKRKGKLVIYDVHEDVPKQISGKYWIPAVLRKVIAPIVEQVENYYAKRLDAIIVANPDTKNRFIRINKTTIDICNYPIANEINNHIIWKEKYNEICYVGGITKIRGIVELILAIAKTNVKLNLAGSYSPESLRSELEVLQGWENVNVCGFVGRKEISGILNRSKIGIVTLYPQANYLVAQPVKMYEYMLAGIPVIASNFALHKEIVEGNSCGICVDPQNPGAIANAIQVLLSNDEKAEQMGKNGRQAVLEKYNWAIEEKKLISLYKSLTT
jgi:glycosyltransferase involved in cell wall biosynthesis